MKKILVVDDNPDVVFSVIDGLKNMSSGWEFVSAGDGREALKKIEKDKFDLILLDIMMPVMDGWDTAAAIKGKPATRSIPIVFLTAKTDGLSKGMGALTSEAYIEKPFKIDDLYKKVKKILETKSA